MSSTIAPPFDHSLVRRDSAKTFLKTTKEKDAENKRKLRNRTLFSDSKQGRKEIGKQAARTLKYLINRSNLASSKASNYQQSEPLRSEDWYKTGTIVDKEIEVFRREQFPQYTPKQISLLKIQSSKIMAYLQLLNYKISLHIAGKNMVLSK